MNQNNEVPTKLHAKLITVATIGAVGGFLFGYDTSVINGAVDAIASPDSGFGLNAAMSGFSVSSAMIGCVVGAWFAGTLADRIGRVRVMQLAAALFVFSALFTGLASNIWVFVIFRIVGGLGVGFTSAIGPAYISEISPSSRRGFLTGFQQMAIALGIVASLVVNDSYLLGSGGAAVTFWAGLETWRWMLMTTAVPGVIMFALTFALPESPRYLVMKARRPSPRRCFSKSWATATPPRRSSRSPRASKARRSPRSPICAARPSASNPWYGSASASPCSSRCPARTSSCSTIPACGRLSVSPSPRL